MVRLAVAAVLVGLAAGACGESGPGGVGLSRGVESGPAEAVTVPADCVAQVARVRREWEAELALGAEQDPDTRFPNLTRPEFDRRLETAEARFGFRVVEDRWLMPLQAAPLLVVQWDDPSRLDDLDALEHAVDGTFELVDPRQPGGSEATGDQRFEGFYFEARDGEGMPFLAVANRWRGDDQAGARWTRFHELQLRPPPPAVAAPVDEACT